MRVASALVLLVLLIAAAGTAAQRTVVGFDFGWRFHFGLTQDGQCTTAAFPLSNYSSVQCMGLSHLVSP